MNPRVLLLLLPLVLAGVAVWLVQSADEPDVPGSTGIATAAPRAADAVAADARAVEATQGAARDTVRAAAAATEARVPFPDDAVWTEVRVVDKATGEPVPEATVTWTDQTTDERFAKDPGLSQEERTWLRRDPERLSLRFGWQATSDRAGRVAVHVTERTLVLARREARYGSLRLQQNIIPPRDGHRIEIEPDIEVLVQVLDARGQPASGMPIGIAQKDARGRWAQQMQWPQSMTRAPDGIAALRHLQEWRADTLAQGNKAVEWRVRTLLPAHDDPGAAFSIDAPPAEPIVLRLPPCGVVRARAELHGVALTTVKSVSLSESRSSPDRGNQNWMMRRATLSRPVDDQGWATFDHVPLGGTYRASASAMSAYLSHEFNGPMTEEQVATVVMSLADEQILLTGRLLDEAKAVLADQEFTLQLRQQYSDTSTTFRSDVHGRFLLFLGPSAKDVPRLERVCIVWRAPGSVLQADLGKRNFRSGLQEAGDIVLQAGQLVVAGRLVSGDGPCKLKVQPSVERREGVEGKPDARWRRQRDLQFQRDDEGHFEFRGEAEPGRYRLTCSSNSHLPVEPIEFALGTKDVVVNIDAGSALAASVLLPKDSPEGLRASLVRDGGPTSTEPQNWRTGDRFVAYPWQHGEGRYQLQWGSIAPGTYTLQLQLWCDKEPLASIADVQVPAPKGGDGRLVDIDLRSSVRINTVRLFDQNGQPIAAYEGALFPVGQDPEKTWLGYDIQGAKSAMLVRPQPLDLLVAKRGYRPLQIRCAGQTTDAKLDPWPTVEIVLDGPPELPKETTLHARLTPRDLREAPYRTMGNEGDRSELMTVPHSTVRVEQGRARVPIGDGPHDATFSVSGKRRSVGLRMPTAEPVFSNTQSLRTALPTASLQQALDKLLAQENEK
jgi:protocatechuate 3,4-dioxygenase beta subunit